MPAKRKAALPDDFQPNETGINYAQQRMVNITSELQTFRNHHNSKGSTMKDWQAAWRTWCDKAVEFGRAGKLAAQPQRQSFRERDEEAAMDKYQEITGKVHPKRLAAQSQNVIDVMPTQLLIGDKP